MKPRIALLALLLSLPAFAAGPWAQKEPALLSADQAFGLLPVEAKSGQVMLRWEIAAGYYLYQNSLQVSALPGKGLPLKLQFPPGQLREDEHFGTVTTHGGAQASSLNLALRLPPAARQLRVQYQGCAEVGVCLPPQTRILDIPPP